VDLADHTNDPDDLSTRIIVLVKLLEQLVGSEGCDCASYLFGS